MIENASVENLHATCRISAPVWSGLTEKQERFAHLVAEGANYSAAYRQMYDTTNMSPPSVWREAHRLSRNQKVARRIAELVTARQEKEHFQAEMRSYRVIALLEDMMRSAKSDAVRLRAAELLGKTLGLFSEKTANKRARHRSIVELEAELEKLLQRSKRA